MLEQIGNYKILERIGAGGMGDVYLGMDVMLEREVAIKSLRPELSQREDLIARFRSEAVAMGRLNHPNIAMVYNFLFQDNQYFLVMEFVRGQTLDKILEQHGPMHYYEAIPLLCMVLDGLEHAHTFGIVHRDIKPSNIIIAESGLKLMDFGIARILQQTRQTRSGHMVGTLEYMSPEHIQGQDTDARTDIYSVGIVAYELLTGNLPFRKNTDYEMIKAQVEEKPQPLRAFSQDIPEVVEKCISKALEKDASKRYASAQEFCQSLTSALEQAPGPIASGGSSRTVLSRLASSARLGITAPRPGTAPRASGSLGAKINGLSFPAKIVLFGLGGGLIGLAILFGVLSFLDSGKKIPDKITAQSGASAPAEDKGGEPAYQAMPLARLQELAKANDPKAQLALGLRYEDGQDVSKDAAQAFDWFRKSAENGLAQGQYYAGVYSMNGKGTTQNLAQAESWLKKATEQKLSEAIDALGICFDKQQKFDEALTWFKKLYEQGGKEAAGYIGIEYINKQEFSEALSWLEKGDEAGLKAAQFSLGMMYFKGLSVDQNYKKAFDCFLRAAKQNQPESLFMLGIMYKRGNGVNTDLVQAEKWLKLAEEYNYAPAAKELESVRKLLGK